VGASGLSAFDWDSGEFIKLGETYSNKLTLNQQMVQD
jgi:hypothetical protein